MWLALAACVDQDLRFSSSVRALVGRAAANEYRAKAFECLSLAECVNDPERRAEILRYARWWMQLTEPVGTFRSAYEVESALLPYQLWPNTTRGSKIFVLDGRDGYGSGC